MEDNLPNHPIEDDIYIGFWINRSLSGFRAATITLDQRQGNMLVSFVAMFVGATARSIWKLVRFTLHHWYSIPTTKDGVHNQRQAVLRNTSLATDAAVQFLEIRHVWRHRTREGTARALALFAVALMISVATTAAGILSSKILIKSSNIALLANPNCTQPLVSNFSAANGNAYWRARYAKYNAQKMAEDLSYATQCYTNEGEHECERFVQPYLPYTPDYNASCPFTSKVCNSTFGNLILDSGELDSMQQLGLNDGPRFSLRYRTHCALLNVTDYTALYTSPPDSGRRYLVYKFGTANQNPWVHAVEQLRKNETTTDFFPGMTGFDNYKIIPYYSIAGGTKFIPELMQAHEFVSLTFLESDGVLYNSDNHDPWFSNASGKRASVLGCAVERLLCNPALPSQIGCINTLVADPSTDEFHTSFDNAWPHRDDKHRMWPIFIAQGGYQRGLPDTLYRFKAASALLARITLENNKQTAEIPSNQWQKEREHIYKATLAGIQSGLVDFARGYWWGSPRCQDDFVCLQSCYSQRVRSASSKFYSFRAWALFTLLVTGVAIMIVSLFIEEIFDALLRLPCLRRNKRLTYGQAEWQAGSTLQLQRIAHENLDLGTWKRTDEAVPVTNLDETLGVFDISNRKHARLAKPSTEMNDLEDVENSGKVSGARDRVQYLRLPSNETLWSPRSPVSDKLWSPRSPSNEQLWSP